MYEDSHSRRGVLGKQVVCGAELSPRTQGALSGAVGFTVWMQGALTDEMRKYGARPG